MIFLEALIVIGCIMLGARYSGIALGFAGILGELILVFGFGLKPAGAPINVILIIMAITCLAATLQSAGGLDFMVHTAEKILRKRPQQITFVAPIVCFLSVMFTGTSYVAIAVYPVISLKYANGLRNGANSDTHRCKQLTEHGEERCNKLREVAGFSAVRTIFQIVGPRKILHCLLGK